LWLNNAGNLMSANASADAKQNQQANRIPAMRTNMG
jgi:hypothetical protein